MKKRGLATSAFRFVLIIGVANLFADMTYEGARGITGPFLGSLGASATIVGAAGKGGKAIAARRSPQERSEAARKAVTARWAKWRESLSQGQR
jgi:hypothetical protein